MDLHPLSRWIFHSDELNREAFPSSFGRCPCSTYVVRNHLPVDLRDPGLDLLSFRKTLQSCFFCFEHFPVILINLLAVFETFFLEIGSNNYNYI